VKILHVYKDYFPVVASGHDVTVLVCGRGYRTHTETEVGVKIVRAGRITTVPSMPLSFSHPLFVARLRPDIVHIHSPYPLGEVSNWLLDRGQATVISYHSDIVRQRNWLLLYAPILRRVLQKADCIIATSPRYVETSPWLRPVRDKCVIVPIGVNPDRFTPDYHMHSGRLELLFVGRLRYYKGLSTLISALPELSETRLTIVGDGPMRDSWQALSTSLGLQHRITFMGDISDDELPGVYQRSDVFVLPASARAEAFGTVLLEAMASGLPCITTELGTGTSWIVQDGVTGLVVLPDVPESMAQAVRCLRDDPARRMQMSRAARARVETQFTQRKMVERVQAVYEEVLGA